MCWNSYLRAYCVTPFGEREPSVSSVPWLLLIGAHDEPAWENLFGTAVILLHLIHSDYWWRSCKIQLNRMAHNLILSVKSCKILWKTPRTVWGFFCPFFLHSSCQGEGVYESGLHVNEVPDMEPTSAPWKISTSINRKGVLSWSVKQSFTEELQIYWVLNVSINVIKMVHSNKHFSEEEQFSVSCQPDWSCELLLKKKKKKARRGNGKQSRLLSFQRHFLQAYSCLLLWSVDLFWWYIGLGRSIS